MNYLLRRQQLSSALDNHHVAFIPAATMVQRSNDTEYPFSQDRNFYFLTGVNEADCLLMLAPGHPNKDIQEVLFIPDFSEFKATWDDAQIDERQAKELSGVNTVLRNGQRLDIAREVLVWADSVSTAQAATQSELNMLPTSTEPKLRRWLKRHGAKEVEDISPAITSLRMVKSPTEIKAIEQCIDVTHHALDAIGPLLKPGVNAREIEATANYEICKIGYEWGYDPIVAVGADSCVLHSRRNDVEIKDGNPILLDIGASRNYYTADISRSYWVGEPNAEYDRLYSVVAGLQKFTIDIIQPGKTLKEVSLSFREALLEQLKQLGLLDKSSELKDTLEFMPHGIGHHLGLDVHDPADYGATLEPGMVLTVEPGIYLSEQEVGIRLEDDVAVTETGCKILGSHE